MAIMEKMIIAGRKMKLVGSLPEMLQPLMSMVFWVLLIELKM